MNRRPPYMCKRCGKEMYSLAEVVEDWDDIYCQQCDPNRQVSTSAATSRSAEESGTPSSPAQRRYAPQEAWGSPTPWRNPHTVRSVPSRSIRALLCLVGLGLMTFGILVLANLYEPKATYRVTRYGIGAGPPSYKKGWELNVGEVVNAFLFIGIGGALVYIAIRPASEDAAKRR